MPSKTDLNQEIAEAIKKVIPSNTPANLRCVCHPDTLYRRQFSPRQGKVT
jgi:hypothetical protein